MAELLRRSKANTFGPRYAEADTVTLGEAGVISHGQASLWRADKRKIPEGGSQAESKSTFETTAPTGAIKDTAIKARIAKREAAFLRRIRLAEIKKRLAESKLEVVKKRADVVTTRAAAKAELAKKELEYERALNQCARVAAEKAVLEREARSEKRIASSPPSAAGFVAVSLAT